MSEVGKAIENLVQSLNEQMNLKVKNAVMMACEMIRIGVSDYDVFMKMKNLDDCEDSYAAIARMYKSVKKENDNV